MIDVVYFTPPLFISPASVLSFVSFMRVETLYLVSFLLPLVLMPIVFPAFVLLAHRKHITEGPGYRKFQERPVAVIGGNVIILIVCITAVIVNLFYDISSLFPVMCVMFMLYVFGTLDDTLGMGWKTKLILQSISVTLLFIGSNYGIHNIYGIHWFSSMPSWFYGIMTLLFGVLVINALNFADGIDGLAASLGVLVGLTMGFWHARHGFVTQAIISFIMVGVMVSFFGFNVFSKRYKSFMGDSGSLVLGLFIFVAVSDDEISLVDGSLLVDSYSFSFVIAVLSYMLFDIVRVVLMRVVQHKPPYKGDRTHLHHIYVDMGMSHFMAVIVILLCNILVIGVWLLTALMGMPIIPQLLMTLLAGAVFIWTPYFSITYFRDKHKERYDAISDKCKSVSTKMDTFVDLMGTAIDYKLYKSKKRS